MTTLNHKTSQPLLNVHAVMPVSYANGPGPRAVVWTQGCRLRCVGCCNPGTHSHKPRMLLDPQRLATSILTIPGIEGLTVSGGEPFEQALAVGILCRAVREAGLSVMVFTGWTYERICCSNNQAVKGLLAQIDILIDGPFVQHLADNDLLWRGSRNQNIRFLTNRYSPEILPGSEQLQVEGQLASGHLDITGFPEISDLAGLAERLSARTGIVLVPTGPQVELYEKTSLK